MMNKGTAYKLRDAIVQGADSLPAEIAIEIPDLFKRWQVGELVKLGDKRRYNDKLYEIIQPHTTQSDWTPDITPALWKEIQPVGVIPEWKQPAGAHDAYQIGDKVLFNGKTWESTIKDNVWAPDVYGWVQI